MNQKRKGSSYERKIVREINELSNFKVGSSRLLSAYLDGKGVDVVDYPDSSNRFPFHIQCKSITGKINYHDLFDKFDLKDKPLIVFHELTEKHGVRFFKLQDYVIMKKEDFYSLIKSIKNEKKTVI